MRAGLVAGQIGLSVILLASAGLLVRAFVEVLRVDAGFRAERLLHPRDPVRYVIAVGLIFTGALVACGIPAYRATDR
jgi:hypothetical protein